MALTLADGRCKCKSQHHLFSPLPVIEAANNEDGRSITNCYSASDIKPFSFKTVNSFTLAAHPIRRRLGYSFLTTPLRNTPSTLFQGTVREWTQYESIHKFGQLGSLFPTSCLRAASEKSRKLTLSTVSAHPSSCQAFSLVSLRASRLLSNGVK